MWSFWRNSKRCWRCFHRCQSRERKIRAGEFLAAQRIVRACDTSSSSTDVLLWFSMMSRVGRQLFLELLTSIYIILIIDKFPLLEWQSWARKERETQLGHWDDTQRKSKNEDKWTIASRSTKTTRHLASRELRHGNLFFVALSQLRLVAFRDFLNFIKA